MAKKKSRPSQYKVEASQVRLDKLEIQNNPALPTIWIDRMQLGVRSDAPVATLRFHTALQDCLVESCRLQVSTDHLKRITDVLCRTLNYYPRPETGERPAKKKLSRKKK